MGAVVPLHNGAQRRVHNQVQVETIGYSTLFVGLVHRKVVTFTEFVDLRWHALLHSSASNETSSQICVSANNLD